MVEEPGDVAISLLQSLPFSLAPTNFLGVIVSYLATACARFIEASNEYSNRKFHTRGCHGNWYIPWALPPSDQQVSSTFPRTPFSLHRQTIGLEGCGKTQKP